MAFVSSPGSTNEDTANIQVSTINTQVSTASTNENTANLSDATVYAFLANQPNSMRARRYYQRTGKKITINGSDTAGYDKSKEMVAIDGAGFDWSFMKDEEVPTNMAIMAFLDLEYDNLRIEFNKSEFDLATYKRGLASVEEQRVFYKKNEIEKLKKEKESNQIKIDNFENASKSLDKLIGSQISDNSRKVMGYASYNGVAPLSTGLFAPPTIDLSNFGLEEFKQPKFEGYGVKVTKSSEVMVSDNVQHKPEQANQPRKMVQKPVMNNVQKRTGQREARPVWNNAMRTNHQKFYNSRRTFAPTAVLTKSGIVPISTARQSSSRAASPVSAVRPINTAAPKPSVNVAKPRINAFHKSHSQSRPFYQQTALNNRNLNNKVNTAKGKRVTSAVRKQGINASDPQVALKDTGIFDSGCSRHMTGNKSYLTDYQDYDGGFVAFVGSYKGGKITEKMCDWKNSILFTKTECLILFPDFKLPDENQVMLKIPRKDNMYSFDLKNIVPLKGLTCLFANATNDESKLWHRRLGHINFKTMNKLMKGNLVRGLPLKIFENDHTCVAC
ncbi:ribonuclease H-like domain-containing protein [Tanacetum coccineum]